jgi:hypothetical protein
MCHHQLIKRGREELSETSGRVYGGSQIFQKPVLRILDIHEMISSTP